SVRQEPRVIAAPPATLAGLEIETTDSALAHLARSAFEPALGAYRAAAVLRATDRLYATGLFNGVWPRVEQAATDSASTLVLALDPHPRISLNAAAGYENDRGGRLWSLLDWRSALLGDPVEARIG